ncbi:MAG: DUF2786 domain-containing protein [Desulfobacterales bacterium]|nr:DUF2786 domain-containing protein [Desulfobacterales bacterium]
MKTNEKFQADLERRILIGLSQEWDAAIWLLDKHQRGLMQRPLFRLVETHSRWGCWDGERHEISISRKLALGYPWDSVREVLHHEMAHQLADRMQTGRREPPHGPTFQKACRALRANPQASGSYLPLKDRYTGKRISDNDRILLRIRKLMALSESSHKHEAEAAMIKAYELMALYNIDLIERDRSRKFVSIFVGQPALRHTRDAYSLSSLLVDFYFIQGIWVSAWVPEREKMGRVLEISGTLENIVSAEYVYNFVRNHINTQWSRYNYKKRLTLHRKTDFATGIIEGFRSRIENRQATERGNPAAGQVVKIEDHRLLAHIRYRYPHIRTYQSAISNQDEQVLEDGRKLGRKMVISRGITEKAGNRRRLIE